MKTNLVLKGLEISGVKIEEVAISQEYSASEVMSCLFGAKRFAKELAKELPGILKDLKVSYDYVEKCNEEERAKSKVKQAEKEFEDLKKANKAKHEQECKKNNYFFEAYRKIAFECKTSEDIGRVLIKAVKHVSVEDFQFLNEVAKNRRMELLFGENEYTVG